MVTIPLANSNLLCQISDEDYDYLSKFIWRLDSLGYVTRHANLKRLTIANCILNIPATHTKLIDHKDCNILNNQRDNLRFTNKSGNAMNKSKTTNKTTSKYKGVYWSKSTNKWAACLMINKKHKHLGIFKEEQDAALAYNTAAIKYFKEFANLNII